MLAHLKSTGIGIENIWYRKKLSVSVSSNILGTVTHWGGERWGHRFMKVFHKIQVFFEGWLPLALLSDVGGDHKPSPASQVLKGSLRFGSLNEHAFLKLLNWNFT